mgnify:CR=1 FL=1
MLGARGAGLGGGRSVVGGRWSVGGGGWSVVGGPRRAKPHRIVFNSILHKNVLLDRDCP